MQSYIAESMLAKRTIEQKECSFMCNDNEARHLFTQNTFNNSAASGVSS